MLQWSDSSLLIVAHGSSRYPEAARDLLRLSERLRDKFARVEIAFWRQQPELSKAHLQGERIFVLPYFAGVGKHTEELIPARLGDDSRIRYCAPIGSNPRIPGLIEKRAGNQSAALLLIAHGSSHHAASRTPQAIAATLREGGAFTEVAVAYLEQEPFARDWRNLMNTEKIVVQPLLLAAGMHANEDLPALFAGSGVQLLSGIGSDDEILAMMLEQIEAAS